MAQNPQRVFGDIVNQATVNDKETFEQWYLQTYQQKLSWEALFAWKDANKFGYQYKIKKNIKYKKGLGKDGQVFNTDDNLLKYSAVEFEDATVSQVSYTVQKVNKISINQFNKSNIGSLKKPWYSDVPDLTKKSAVIDEMNTGVIKAIQKINSNLKTSDYNIIILDFGNLIFNDRDEGDFSKDVNVSFDLDGENWLTGKTSGIQITVPAATKKETVNNVPHVKLNKS